MPELDEINEKDVPSAMRGVKTWDDVRDRMTMIALANKAYGGAPLPISEFPLIIAKDYPFQDLQGITREHLDQTKEERDEEKKQTDLVGNIFRAMQQVMTPAEIVKLTDLPYIINSWYSRRHEAYVSVRLKANGKVTYELDYKGLRWQERWVMQFGTSCAWQEAVSADAEFTAMLKLKQHVTPQAWKSYIITGWFLETSPRSDVTYVFRKCRPTIALGKDESRENRVPITALCLHPVGHYSGTHAGVMCPTDDVLAHLLMMRGDERKFWAKANQHPLYTVPAGV